MENFADIITAAAKTPLGILALAMLILGTIALKFFDKDTNPGLKLSVFLILALGFGLAGFFALNSKMETQKTTGYKFEYFTTYLNKSGTGVLQARNDEYVIYDEPGGCGPNDVAKCTTDNDGMLRAYIKDSCSGSGKFGNKINSTGTISRGVDNTFIVSCKVN